MSPRWVSTAGMSPAEIQATVEDAATMDPVGVWTFAEPPTVNGAPITGGSTLATIPAGSMIVVQKAGGIWPGGSASVGVRPTARADVTVVWKGADPSPSIIASGTGGMLNGVDMRFVTT